MNEKNFNSIPANACLMSVGEFKLGDNGEGSKTAPISLVARSGKPIEHWFWGKVVHDLSGMRLHKARLAIDYVHDDKEIIGYLNHFDSSSGDLIASGALVPFKDNDRATEILHKLSQGVPYEASINFGGDGITVEELQEGMTAVVNGFTLAGPACIIRQWPLRGVAVCPYGADANTESRALANTNKTFSATVASATVPVEKTPTEEGTQMSDTSVEVVATVTVTEATEEVISEEVKAETPSPVDEAKPVEDTPAEVIETVEAPSVETVKETQLSKEEFTQIADKFGNDIAVECMKASKGFGHALSLYCAKIESENQELKSRVAELSAKFSVGGIPVPVAEIKPKSKLFNTGK